MIHRAKPLPLAFSRYSCDTVIWILWATEMAVILPPGARLYSLTSGTGHRMLLRLAVIGGGRAAKLSYLTCSHSLKLFGRLFYTHAYEDVFESEDVFAEGSTSLIIRPGIVSFKINRNGFVSHSFFFFSLWVLFVCLFYCCFGVFLSCSGYV